MGLGSLFQKKTNYFDRQIAPKCGYCQYGKRTKEGNRILCEKNVCLKEEHDSCNKFVYSPLKRVPVKQLKNEGFVADEEIYVDVVDKEPVPAAQPAPVAPAAQPATAAPVVQPAPAAPVVQPATAAPVVQPAPAAPVVQPAPAVPAAQPAPAVPAAQPTPEAPVQPNGVEAIPQVQAAAIPGFGDLNELAQAAALVDAASAAEAPQETN